MKVIEKLGNCEAVRGLSPGGLGRLTATAGGTPDENPYRSGTAQHRAWIEHFQDVRVLESLEFIGESGRRISGRQLDS